MARIKVRLIAALGLISLPVSGWAQAEGPEATSSQIVPATAPASPVPVRTYGAEPRIDMITLSPGGDLVARVETIDGHRILIVSRLSDASIQLTLRVGDAKVRGLDFIDEDHILVLTSRTQAIAAGGDRSELSVGQIVDLKTRRSAAVLDRTADVLGSPFGPVEVLYTSSGPLVLARGANMRSGDLSLHRIDPSNGAGRVVQKMTPEVRSYVVDAEGEVLATSEYVSRSGRWSLKLRQGDWLRENWGVTAPLDPPSLMGLGRTPGTVLVQAYRPDVDVASGSDSGSQFFEVTVATGEWKRLSYQHFPRGFVFHPRTKLLIGYAYTEDMGVRYAFFDDLASRRWAAIERAFPDQYPKPTSWSHDMDVILVFIDRADSGHYQLVDFETGRADLAGEMFPDLTPERLGEVRHLTYKAADGLEIPAYMTLPPGVTDPKNLPLIVLAHGGPASRDDARFDYWAQAVASRGYVVLQPNFRGSTGYGRAFLEAGFGEWGRKMQTDLSDGVRHLAEQGVIDPARVCIMGASYGGYAALAGLTLDSDVYRCGVSVSGVSDLRRMLRWEAARAGSRNNHGIRYWTRFMGADGVGDRDLDPYSPALQVGAVKVPLLLIHGKDDTVVPIEQSRVMASAMRAANKPVEFIELNGEDHWLSRSDTRIRMLEEAVRFIETHNPPH